MIFKLIVAAFILVIDVSSTPLAQVEGYVNYNSLDEITLDCALDGGETGICLDSEVCPGENDNFLLQFPSRCGLRDGGMGVCCHARQVLQTSVLGETCMFNNSFGRCRDIGDCPFLDHLRELKQYVVCDIKQAAICCPEEPGVLALNEEEKRNGDFCTLPNKTLGICKEVELCPGESSVPTTTTNTTFCDDYERLRCCPDLDGFSHYKDVQNLESRISPSNIPWKGSNCGLTSGVKGVCLDIKDCAKALNSTSIAYPEYCDERTRLVCCPAKEGTQFYGSQSPNPYAGSGGCTANSGQMGTCMTATDCQRAMNTNSMGSPQYCPGQNNLVCCPTTQGNNNYGNQAVGQYGGSPSLCKMLTGKSGSCMSTVDCQRALNINYLPSLEYCPQQPGFVCCPAVQVPNSLATPSLGLWNGGECYLRTGQKGTCLGFSDCTRTLSTNSLVSPEYCQEETLLVCCPTTQGTYYSTTQAVGSPSGGNSCLLRTGQRGTCLGFSDCTRSLNLVSLASPDYCQEHSLIVCCPTTQVSSNYYGSTQPGGYGGSMSGVYTNSQPGSYAGSQAGYYGSSQSSGLWKGSPCTLRTGQSGTCTDFSECNRNQQYTTTFTYTEYCQEQTQLVCCSQSNVYPSALNPSYASTTSSIYPSSTTSYPSSTVGGYSSTSIGNYPSANYGNYPSSNYGNYPSSNYGNYPSQQYTSSCIMKSGQRGTCMDYSSCTRALNSGTLSYTEYCAGQSLVCCPVTQGVSNTSPGSGVDVYVSAPRTNFQCGESRTDGLQGNANRYPLELYDWGMDSTDRTRSSNYMALLGRRHDSRAVDWFCNGAIINERWVLSAAHCSLDKDVSVVRLGEYDFNDDFDSPSYRDYTINKIVRYPDYISSKGYHDLALIMLSTNVNLGSSTNPICLPWSTGQQITSGSSVIQSGWGSSRLHGNYLSYPTQVTLSVLPAYDCEQAYTGQLDFKSAFPNGLGKDTLCASPRSKVQYCQGDFGGLLTQRDNHGRNVLVGVEFRSYDCNNQRRPGLFVNLQMSPYLSWIKEVAFGSQYATYP